MEKIVLSEKEINEILEYLAQRPYNEVYKLISMIQRNWQEQHKGEDKGNSK